MMHKLPKLAPDRDRSLDRIDRSAIQLLWHSAFWDYPRSGLLLYRGEKHWFQEIDEDEPTDRSPRFLVVRLTDEQLREERYWHELFREKVGTHSDYDQEQREVGALRPGEIW